ncbi:MAG: PLD nuclease N-terminal domain-containing protein [Microbacteriaceae bacterium]
MRVVLTGLVIAVVVGLMIYALVDVLRSDPNSRRAVPKLLWVLIVVLAPVVGSVLWLVVSRKGSGSVEPLTRRSVAPDDDPDFLRGIERDHAQDERIRLLEEQLSEHDDPDSPSGKSDDSGADHGSDRGA